MLVLAQHWHERSAGSYIPESEVKLDELAQREHGIEAGLG